MTCCHIHYTFRPNWKLPEDGQDKWQKNVGLCNKYIVQLTAGVICVY